MLLLLKTYCVLACKLDVSTQTIINLIFLAQNAVNDQQRVEATKTAREAAHALHAVLQAGLGDDQTG